MPRSTRKESIGERIAPELFCTKPEPLDVLLGLRDRDAADGVGVAAQELRRRVHDDVRAERQRLLEVGRAERVVDDDDARRPGARAPRGAAMSASRIVGFVGDSRWSMRVSGRIARSTAAGSAVSTKSNVTP